jgi:hypothetical protein
MGRSWGQSRLSIRTPQTLVLGPIRAAGRADRNAHHGHDGGRLSTRPARVLSRPRRHTLPTHNRTIAHAAAASTPRGRERFGIEMGTNGGTVDGRDGERERDLRLPRLFEELGLAKASGTYAKTLAKLASADVLVLDDLGIQKIREADRNDAASSTG